MTPSSDNPPQSVEATIAKIISQTIGREISVANENLEALNMDSLTRLEIAAMLEKQFNLELTEDIATEFTSISRIARIIRRLTHIQADSSV